MFRMIHMLRRGSKGTRYNKYTWLSKASIISVFKYYSAFKTMQILKCRTIFQLEVHCNETHYSRVNK